MVCKWQVHHKARLERQETEQESMLNDYMQIVSPYATILLDRCLVSLFYPELSQILLITPPQYNLTQRLIPGSYGRGRAPATFTPAPIHASSLASGGCIGKQKKQGPGEVDGA